VTLGYTLAAVGASTTGSAAVSRADHIVQPLGRQGKFGRPLSDADIARLLALEQALVTSLVRGLVTAKQVRRTGDGRWELTAPSRRSSICAVSVRAGSASGAASERFGGKREVAVH
jgi:hypothetical protein